MNGNWERNDDSKDGIDNKSNLICIFFCTLFEIADAQKRYCAHFHEIDSSQLRFRLFANINP